MICVDKGCIAYGKFFFDGKYCYICGKPLQKEQMCVNGHEVSVHDIFCAKCGAKIGDPLVQENALDGIAKAQAEIPDKYQHVPIESDLFDHERDIDNQDDEPENV